MNNKVDEKTRTQRIKEMADITAKYGRIVAENNAGDGSLGLIFRKKRIGNKTVYFGRQLLVENMDCEYRIAQVKNARLGGRWRSSVPWMVGFLPANEVKQLLKGECVSRGCSHG